MGPFQKINTGYNTTFRPGRLTIGMVLPIENHAQNAVPNLEHHLARVQLIDSLGFAALWVRDVPFHVPSFGDAGQTYDPFTYLGFLAGQTKQIALGAASIALPLHHPVHVAKSANTIDQLSGGRLILGIASGDRMEEYPATNHSYENRGGSFRSAYQYLRSAEENFPVLEDNQFGHLNGSVEILPKPHGHKLPLLVTGHSQQSLEWIAEHTDGWMYYPRDFNTQTLRIKQWRQQVSRFHSWDKPFMQPLYLDLIDDSDYKPQRIHLGIRTGSKFLLEYLSSLQEIGVNHVALNLRFNSSPIETSLNLLAQNVLPHFN